MICGNLHSDSTCAVMENHNVVDLAQRLLKIPSENPPGDTSAIAGEIKNILESVPGISVQLHSVQEKIINVVATVKGNKPGRRLILNGHLDTFPIGNSDDWSFSPFGQISDNRLYGRGVSDMKGGLAASIHAAMMLAECPESWNGELVLTFAGDEEVMGVLGTQALIDQVEQATGDAMLNADAGSTRVLRFGEKGMLWLNLTAQGKTGHAAHVHLGASAVDRIVEAITIIKEVCNLPVNPPELVAQAIAKSKDASESLSGKGETQTLENITVTFGTLNAGTIPNLIPDKAQATVDIRIPVGSSVAEIERHINKRLKKVEGVDYEVTRRYEPNWTNPGHEIVQLTADVCEEVLGERPAVNMRVGASDARLYRYANIPSVICGLTPNNMGAEDEYVEIEELVDLGRIFAETALRYLQS